MSHNLSLPSEITCLIQEFSRPVTRPDWRVGSPLSSLIHNELRRIGYNNFNWTNMTLASFLISHDLMKRSVFNLDNEIEYNLWKSIIIFVEKQFLENGYYL